MTYPADSSGVSGGVSGTYVGTTLVDAPTPYPGVPKVRQLNGTGDRILGANTLANDFFAGLVFWRGNTSLPADDDVGQRLITQPSSSPNRTRVAVGINRGKLAIIMELRRGSDASAVVPLYMFESDVDVMDTDKHRLAIWVEESNALGHVEIVVYLDGKEAIHFEDTHYLDTVGFGGARVLSPAPFIPACFGSDSGTRNFNGYLSEVFTYNQSNSLKPDAFGALQFMRYLEALDEGVPFREFTGAPFAFHYDIMPEPGGLTPERNWVITRDSNLVKPETYEFVSKPGTNTPRARSALVLPFVVSTIFPIQTAEFRFQTGSNPNLQNLSVGAVQGVIVSFSNSLLGETADSFCYLPDGRIRRNNTTVTSSLPTWGFNDYIGMQWDSATQGITLFKNGQEVYNFVPGGVGWYPAAQFGDNAVTVASGTRLPKYFPANTAGIPRFVQSPLTSELKYGKIAEICCPIQETLGTGFFNVVGPIVNAGVCSQVGIGSIGPSITGDPNDHSRIIGSIFEVNSNALAGPKDDFFYGIAFTPSATDLVGTKVIMGTIAPADLWGLRLVSGALEAWVGGVSATLPAGRIVAGGRYYVALSRTPQGRLRVWLSGGWIAQSTALTVPVSPSLARKIAVGYTTDGNNKFTGSVSHLLVGSLTPPAWKLNRIRMAGSWTVPNHLALTGEFTSAKGQLTGALSLFGGAGPYTVTVSAGTAPPGISFSVVDGTVVASGTSTASGPYSWTLRAEDSNGLTSDLAMTHTLQVPWDPSQLAGIVAQFDETTSILTSTTKVTQWATKPGVGALSFNSNSTDRAPTLQPKGMRGGIRALVFDGVNDALYLSDSAARNIGTNKAGLWAMGVSRFLSTPATGNAVVFALPGANGNNSKFTLVLEPIGAAFYYQLHASRGAGAPVSQLTPALLSNPSAWHTWFVYVDFQTNVAQLRVNGTVVAQSNSFVSPTGLVENTSATRSPTLAAWPLQTGATSSATSNVGNIEMSVFLIGDGTPPVSADIDKAMGWAAHRYNLAGVLPGSHPYKTSPP